MTEKEITPQPNLIPFSLHLLVIYTVARRTSQEHIGTREEWRNNVFRAKQVRNYMNKQSKQRGAKATEVKLAIKRYPQTYTYFGNSEPP